MWNSPQLDQIKQQLGASSALDPNVLVVICAVCLAMVFFWIGRKSNRHSFKELRRQNYELRHALAEISLHKYGPRD